MGKDKNEQNREKLRVMKTLNTDKKVKMVGELSDADFDRIEKQKELQTIQPGTYSYKVALMNDNLRNQRDKCYHEVDKVIWGIKNSQAMVARLKEQLDTGKITEQLKDGVTMTETELKLDIEHHKMGEYANSKSVIKELVMLRSIVGYHDPAKLEILNENEFETYCKKVDTTLKELGYDLFDSTVKTLQEK